MCRRAEAIPLRAHHGICLAYYRGQGYSDSFVRNMDAVLDRLGEDPLIQLKVGADVICTACPNCQAGACAAGEKPEGYDRAVLHVCGLQEEAELPASTFVSRIQERILAPGLRERICGDCQWADLCRGRSRWEATEKTSPPGVGGDVQA